MRILNLMALVPFSLLLSLPLRAEVGITINSTLPYVEVRDDGELLEAGGAFSYAQWNSSAQRGKLQILQCIAGRKSASQLNRPFTDALRRKEFPQEYFHVTTVVNLDDSMVFTSGIVVDSLKDKKRARPFLSFVVDNEGDAANHWNLELGSSAIIVVSPQGQVLYFKDGALSGEEIDRTLNLIEFELEKMTPSVVSVANQ